MIQVHFMAIAMAAHKMFQVDKLVGGIPFCAPIN